MNWSDFCNTSEKNPEDCLTGGYARAFSQHLLDEYKRTDGQHRFGAFLFQSIPDFGDTERVVDADGDIYRVQGFRSPGKVKADNASLWNSSTLVPVGTHWGEVKKHSTYSIPLSSLNN